MLCECGHYHQDHIDLYADEPTDDACACCEPKCDCKEFTEMVEWPFAV